MQTFTKKNVSLHEYSTYLLISHLQIVPCPKIISYNRKTQELIIEKIPKEFYHEFKNFIRIFNNYDKYNFND